MGQLTTIVMDTARLLPRDITMSLGDRGSPGRHIPADAQHCERVHEVGDGVSVDGVCRKGEMQGIENPERGQSMYRELRVV